LVTLTSGNKKEVRIMYEKEIEEKMGELPEDLRREILDYLEFLLKKLRQRNSSSTGKVVYQRYGRNSLPLSCNTRLRGGDDVFSGYKYIFGNHIETG
jgi:hypothetical protein